MIEFDSLVWFRYTLSVTSLIVAFWLFCMTARNFRKLEFGQRLWATGAILILIYVADECRAAASINLEAQWRLIPLTLGLLAYFAYLLEPRNRKLIRFGRPTFNP